MATPSSILGWRIPWTEELGRLQYSTICLEVYMESYQECGHSMNILDLREEAKERNYYIFLPYNDYVKL